MLKWCHTCKKNAFVGSAAELGMWVLPMQNMPNVCVLENQVAAVLGVSTSIIFKLKVKFHITGVLVEHMREWASHEDSQRRQTPCQHLGTAGSLPQTAVAFGFLPRLIWKRLQTAYLQSRAGLPGGLPCLPFVTSYCNACFYLVSAECALEPEVEEPYV